MGKTQEIGFGWLRLRCLIDIQVETQRWLLEVEFRG